MADVQAENGYVRIATELFEAMCRTRIPGEARQVLDVIIRKTYGFQKTHDEISLSQFVLATGLSKRHICRAIKKLIAMNLITKKGEAQWQTYSIIKDFDRWNISPKKAHVPNMGKGITKKGEASSPKKAPTIDITTKDTITKDNISLSQLALVTLLRDKILVNNPKALIKPNYEKNWGKAIRLMVEADKRTEDDIRLIIEWCQKDSFWKMNILSGDKLREKFDQLWMKMEATGGTGFGSHKERARQADSDRIGKIAWQK